MDVGRGLTLVLVLATAVMGQSPSKSLLVDLSSNIRTLADQVAPAVVQIAVNGYGALEGSPGHTVSMFGKQESIGSGVVVDADGYIMTNAHVVTGAVSIKVGFAPPGAGEKADAGAELERVEARVVGVDAESDLALLKIERPGLKALEFMDSDRLRQGELVLAFGAPMGLPNSVSLGVVSAPARSLSDDDSMVYVQTDASINPGNSGGALVNMDGRLAGLNTFILSKSGGNEGLGFAIPANTIRDVYLQLRRNGEVKRGELGILAQNITPVLAKGLSLARDRGVVLSDVEPDGPAAKAGLEPGDIVLSLDGKAILSTNQLENRIFRRQAGERVRLNVLRGENSRTVSAKVRERPGATGLLGRLIEPQKNLIARLGVVCVQIDKDLAAMLPGIRRQYGLIVAAKSPGGMAQFVDLQAGDIISAVNTLPTPFLETLRSSLDELKPGDPVVLQIERNGRLQYLAFEFDR
jgi:serine protease Do